MNISSAEILRTARLASGITQTELALRLGTTQSVISAYEAGRRDPSLRTLERMISGTGKTLVIGLEDASGALPLMQRVLRLRGELVAVLAELGGRSPRLFGSVARGTETRGSDIDIVVELDGGVGLFALGLMRSRAESILGAPVDIVPSTDLKPDVRASIDRDAIAL